MPERDQLLILALDLRATKRQWIHQIITQQGRLLYSTKRTEEALRWLFDSDNTRFWIRTEGGDLLCTLEPLRK